MPDAWTRALADLRCDRIPDAARLQAKYCILDALGGGLAGHDHPAIAGLCRALATLGERGEAGVLASAETRPISQAVLLNGTMLQVHDLDEVHLSSNTHPTVAVLPAILSLAEIRHASGAELLAAFVGGYDAVVRVGRAIGAAQQERGWHVSSTAGTFGAAVAAARLMGLGPDGIGAAVNLAGTQAGGVRATFGSVTKHLHFGRAALNGLYAATWAEAGITAGGDTLTHPLGFAAASSGTAVTGWMPEGEPFAAVREATFKRFPCCFENHSAIEACLCLRADGMVPGRIAAVEVRVRPEILPLVGDGQPSSAMAAKFSLAHNVALALTQGGVALAHFADGPDALDGVADMRCRVRVIPDNGLRPDEAVVSVTEDNARARTARAVYDGGAGTWTREQADTKFLRYATPALGRPRAEQLRDIVMNLESVRDCADLMMACRAAG